MILSPFQTFITIIMLMLGTMCTRFLPFIFFRADRATPQYVQRLGRVLPYAVIGLLVVYCLKGVSFTSGPYGLPEFISILIIAVLHVWKKNTLLSIFAGTASYMLLIQYIF
ncbi:branched-chain amino acid transporter permease [Ruminiclostridium cellobioparum]|uniref:branched-chain amino acid transporter permease n=1 Tax=Ruminiclostridium cellobioparum TaxID=29355 RepID=UPI0004865D8D|nr:branched-chain amino acid transporter permease [Ruminiclostridium cellobioparum]